MFSSPRSLNIHVEIRKIKLERKIPPPPLLSIYETRSARKFIFPDILANDLSILLLIYFSVILDYDFLTFELREGKERKKNWRFFPKELESLDKRFIYRESVSLREETENIRE